MTLDSEVILQHLSLTDGLLLLEKKHFRGAVVSGWKILYDCTWKAEK